MNRWQQLLNGLIDRKPPWGPPPAIVNLNLPYPNSWEAGKIESEWEIDERFFHDRKAVFGGYIAALADQVLGLVVMTVLEDDEHFATSDLRTSFFRPVKGKSLKIEARVVHKGRNMAHVEVDFIRDDGKLAAKSTATQVIQKHP